MRGVPSVLVGTSAELVEGVYAELRGLLDSLFPADGPLVEGQQAEEDGSSGGWVPVVGEGWREDAGGMRREERACEAYMVLKPQPPQSEDAAH